MSTSVIACDISEFQPPVTDAYPHRWLTFRACDGYYRDRNVAANLAWSVRARAAGKLAGFAVYVVYRPGASGAILKHLDDLNVPTDCVVMVDAESFGGQVTGDHSREINALCSTLSRRQGDRSRVWAYGNRGPDLEVWPSKPDWIGWVVASYGGSRPEGVTNLIGWQYTDGQWSVPGKPSTSPPFGACDHNELYLDNLEADVPLTPQDAEAVAAAVWRYQYQNRQALAYLVAGADPARIAAAVVAALPKNGAALTEADVEAAVRTVFADAGAAK